MDTGRERRDTWNSVLLVAAATGLAAGLYLVTYQALHYQALATVIGAGIAAASALSVFVRQRWVGALVAALALAATALLLIADSVTVPAVAAATMAAGAGIVMLAMPRAGSE